MAHEWVILANLFGLLMGIALLSKHFEDSHVPAALPKILPDDWNGGCMLLVMVFVLSSFLDNIAAALIGGTMASGVFRGKCTSGIWPRSCGVECRRLGKRRRGYHHDDDVDRGREPISVLEAFVAAGVALCISGVVRAKQQQAYSAHHQGRAARACASTGRGSGSSASSSWWRSSANVVANLRFPELLDRIPVIGLAVWAAILVSVPLRKPDWSLLPATLKGTIFLLSLVAAASMMPVEKLPAASWQTALGLGFLSAVFDNIPLTALALHQGGYDWGFLAYAVGFGGSMIWFGSSAGVALSNNFPEAKNALLWLRHGWHVALAYVVGFAVMLAVLGWKPDPRCERRAPRPLPPLSRRADPSRRRGIRALYAPSKAIRGGTIALPRGGD
jgi:hypothetical protein